MTCGAEEKAMNENVEREGHKRGDRDCARINAQRGPNGIGHRSLEPVPKQLPVVHSWDANAKKRRGRRAEVEILDGHGHGPTDVTNQMYIKIKNVV